MTPGLHPEPRAAVVARLVAIAERCEHTTERLIAQWIETELELREKGGLIDENYSPSISRMERTEG